MGMAHAIFLVAGALAGGIVSGLTGFGTAITALGIWVYAIPPTVAASLAVICSTISQFQTLHLIWRQILWRRVLIFVVPGLFGVPIGTYLLPLIEPYAADVAFNGVTSQGPIAAYVGKLASLLGEHEAAEEYLLASSKELSAEATVDPDTSDQHPLEDEQPDSVLQRRGFGHAVTGLDPDLPRGAGVDRLLPPFGIDRV